MNRLRTGLAILAAGLFLMGCDQLTGDSGGGGSKPNLKDTNWLGVVVNGYAVGGQQRLEVTFDADGNISAVLVGNVDQGLTGTVEHEQGDIFGFVLSDGTAGGYIVVGDGAAFLLEDGTYGSLSNGATALGSPYAVPDLAGSWKGTYVTVDSAFNLVDVIDSDATVAADGMYSGSRADGVTFDDDGIAITVSDTSLGLFYGGIADTTGFVGYVDVLLSPSKTFGATVSCDFAGDPPSFCGYNAWEKQ